MKAREPRTADELGARRRRHVLHRRRQRVEQGHAPAVTVSAVVPTLNEEKNVGWVLRRIPQWVTEVIVVDGRSTDRTVEMARRARPGVRIVEEHQPGKGAALRAGFEAARGDVIVMIDADGSMDPSEMSRYIAKLVEGYDFVKGSRFVEGGGSSDITRLRDAGNRSLLGLVNLLYRAPFTDLCYGYIAFRRSALDAMRLNGDGFEIETELVVSAVKAGLRIGEVASFEGERRYGESHLNTFRDGFRVVRTLLKERVTVPAVVTTPDPEAVAATVAPEDVVSLAEAPIVERRLAERREDERRAAERRARGGRSERFTIRAEDDSRDGDRRAADRRFGDRRETEETGAEALV